MRSITNIVGTPTLLHSHAADSLHYAITQHRISHIYADGIQLYIHSDFKNPTILLNNKNI